MPNLEDVHEGRDGWLFLTGGNNSPLGMFCYDDERRAKSLAAWSSALSERINSFREMGCSYIHLIVPEKISIYKSELLLNLPEKMSLGEGLISSLSPLEKEHVPNLFDYFRSSPDRSRLYYRTDSHWTWVGAFQAMQLALYKLGHSLTQEQYLDLRDRPRRTIDFSGDLAGPFNLAREKAERISFKKNATIAYENDIIILKRLRNAENDVGLHVGSSLRLTNNAPLIDKSVALFGDSFSECRDGLLTFLLGEIFSSITFVWSTSIDRDVISQIKPDIVITEMTERFIWLPPNDGFDLSSFVKNRIAGIDQA